MAEIIRNWLPLEQVLGALITDHDIGREEGTQLVREAIQDGNISLRILAERDRWEHLGAEECAKITVDLENGVLVGRKRLPRPVFLILDHDGELPAEITPPTAPEGAPAPRWMLSEPLERVEINLPQLERRVDAHLRMRRQALKRAGGRPPEHRWDMIALEIGRWVFHNGFPEPVAPLIEHLQHFCAKEFQREPAESELRRRVNQALATIAEPISGVSGGQRR